MLDREISGKVKFGLMFFGLFLLLDVFFERSPIEVSLGDKFKERNYHTASEYNEYYLYLNSYASTFSVKVTGFAYMYLQKGDKLNLYKSLIFGRKVRVADKYESFSVQGIFNYLFYGLIFASFLPILDQFFFFRRYFNH